MHFEALQETLKKGLSIVAPAVAGKSTLPVLSNILLRADDEGLWLSATNLEVGIRTKIGAKVETHGATTLPAKLLIDLIAGLPNVPITFDLNGRSQETTITAGKFSTKIKGIDAEEFPTLVTSGADPALTLPASDWHTVANVVAPSAADDKTRPVLAGVHIETNAPDVVFEAADSYRLARKTFSAPGASVDTLIPATSIMLVRKVFADGDVSLSEANDGALALFSDGVTTLSSRTIEGAYPDIDRIIPTTYTTRIVVPTADLLSALRLAKPFAEATSNRLYLDLAEVADQDGKLGIFASAAEVGEHSAVVDVIASGKPTKIILNHSYLVEAVTACGAGDVVIELQTEMHAAILRPVGDDTLLQLVMPMSVR